ncbi:MAG: glycosyltransferase family 2 protein [Chloroflexi bacterium]|nr:glycosyltransferase family 2 protein [Chloroflexota bacterium]
MRAPWIDVIVPTFNNSGELMACLEALRRQSGIAPRVLVCVDGSIDDTRDMVVNLSPQIAMAVLEHGDRQNHGRSSARNLALSAVRANFVALVDSDMRLDPEALGHHLRVVEANDVVSIGAVVYETGGSSLWARYQATRGRAKRRDGAAVRPLDFTSANAVMRAEHFLAVGGFDEHLDGYGGEDTELGLRLAEERHLTFVYNEQAVARTIETKSVAEGLSQLDRYARTNLRAIRRRHPNGPAPFWIDRATSRRIRDRILRLALNRVGEATARTLLPRMPFQVQRRLLDYLVIRTVFNGYLDGPR